METINKIQSIDGAIKPRGFVTIATGADKYYQLAQDLLRSYRLNGKSDLPFAIICDRVCPEIQDFDDVIICKDPNNSYLDKLSLFDYIPYNETIFIDADSLILFPIDQLWDDFSTEDDFSCYGRPLPLDSKDGWFFYEDMGELKDQLSFIVSMHGGIYYLRNTDNCKKIFDMAKYFAENYHNYRFAEFSQPADEPVLALSMALSGLKPCEKDGRILFYPSFDGKLHVNENGKLALNRKLCEPIVLHFGNRHIPRYIYQFLRANMKAQENSGKLTIINRIKIFVKCAPIDAKFVTKRILKKIIPMKLVRLIRGKR